MNKWKDRVLNILMLLAVGAALAVTWGRPSPESDTTLMLPIADTPVPAPTATPDPIAAYRERREQDRRQEEQALLTLIEGDRAAAETRADAQAQLLQLQRNREIELAVEAALIARGYPDALCVARQDAVTILMNREIGESDAALILYLAQEASGADPKNIRISS